MSNQRRSRHLTLSRTQLRAQDHLKDALEGIKKWQRCDGVSLEKNKTVWEDFQLCLTEYDKAMVRAIRAGLADHPAADPTLKRIIAEYVSVNRLLGQWDLLRHARSGVEKGVRRPIPEADLHLWHEIEQAAVDYECRLGRPPTQSMLKKLLIADRTLPRMSREGFSKLLERLDLAHVCRD